ncbi:MAG: NUDIX domain-containing protein [Corynebacterium sp.]|uniref:NUDIX domain-containing protein n=1 Tax=unclassified Corynebacterium TaxID=2624378 RepID=UPI00264863E9|nr:NUDIX hydrolase [Corynebacterium sp.]MDN5582403.1 NUDIX hydrolase [Corynebacterium sp.]MDN5719632.1 NUDIX hydrolase [Corynebacterium sp.]MDN6326297.1 NUDIX hydrolase [Corynebacterium sp.]
MEYRILSSELLVDAPVVALRRDRITTATGEARREVVEHFGAAAIVALRNSPRDSPSDSSQPGRPEVMLVRQYRRPVDRYLWELPAGLLDMAGEDPLSTARRELAEEAGLSAGRWHLLGDICPSPGISEEMCRIFLAEDVHPLTAEDAAELEEATGEEADMTSRWTPVDEAVDMVRRGEIVNATAVAGLLHLHAGTRRDVSEPFDHHSGLAERRQGGLARGTDMKHVR